MIIKIVCAGADFFKDLYKPDIKEMLVGVDGGIYNIINKGLNIHLGLGDFDSCNIEEVILNCDKVKKFPKEKDFGDLELAIQEVINIPHKKIIIYNVTGGRLDHFLASLNILDKYSYDNIEIIDDKNIIKVINKTTIFQKSHYRYLSIFALEEDTVITLRGFKYNLDKYHLKPNDNLCLSNEIIDEAEIEVNDKKLLILETL